MANIQSEYVLPVTVASYDVGPDDRMRLSAVLRYQQEAAEQHLAPGGMGWNALMQDGIAFVASRWHTQITRLPRMGERVQVTTWHRERKGPRFYRCFRWTGGDGQPLVCGVMQYALVSVQDHRLLRGDVFDRYGIEDQPARTVGCADPDRFRLPPTVPAEQMTIRWSDTDRNAHLNNTRFADLVCDALPGGMPGRDLVDLQLYFSGEARMGDTLVLENAVADGVAYVYGHTARGPVLAARVTCRGGF